MKRREEERRGDEEKRWVDEEMKRWGHDSVKSGTGWKHHLVYDGGAADACIHSFKLLGHEVGAGWRVHQEVLDLGVARNQGVPDDFLRAEAVAVLDGALHV